MMHSTLLLGLDSPHNFIRSDASVLKQTQGSSLSYAKCNSCNPVKQKTCVASCNLDPL